VNAPDFTRENGARRLGLTGQRENIGFDPASGHITTRIEADYEIGRTHDLSRILVHRTVANNYDPLHARPHAVASAAAKNTWRRSGGKSL
jgi:hypothetical protein